MYDESDLDAYVRLSAFVEKWLLRALCALLILLILAQGLLRNEAFRRFAVPVDRLEGIPYQYRLEPAAAPERQASFGG